MTGIQRPLSSLLLLALLVLITSDQGSCDAFYIVTSPGNYCPDEYLSSGQNQSSCLTLSEFVSLQIDHSQLQTLSLTLEPGNHTLSSPLLVPTNISSFTILAANVTSSVTVHCKNDSGLQISTVGHVLVEGVDFIGCEANKVEFVTNFTLKDFIFYCSTLNLETVQNISIARGSFSSSAFVKTTLYVYRSTLYLQETDFLNNRGNIAGALVVNHANTFINQCTFFNNSILDSSFCGGAIFATDLNRFGFGSGTETLTITGSNFTANKAIASESSISNGGAICWAEYGSLLISNTTFERNGAKLYGGAIYAISSHTAVNLRTIQIEGSQFISNSVDDTIRDGSGAVHIDGDSGILVKVDQCSFTNNVGGVKLDSGLVVFNSTQSEFTNNTGRALYLTQDRILFDGLVVIDQCKFTDNFDHSFDYLSPGVIGGGAIAINSGTIFPAYRYTVQINGSTFTHNYANASGGAINILAQGREGSTTVVQVHNSSFVDNSCYYYTSTGFINRELSQGGAINVQITGSTSVASITQSVFIDNKCKTSLYYSLAEQYNISPFLKGGALALAAGRININQSVFVHNEANIGGALYINRTSELLISESTFQENFNVIPAPEFDSTEVSAGVMFVSMNTNSTAIERSVFLNNSASKCGVMDFNREAYREDNSLSISDSYFENNQATQNEGGVFCFTGGEVTVSNSTFIGNSANTNGGVISAVNTHLRMTVVENRATGNGGAVYLDQGGQAKMSDSKFISNRATSGGALSVAGFRLELEDVVAFNNTAVLNGDVMTSCKSAAVLPEDLESLLFIQVDPNYYNDGSYCIYYNEQFRDLQNSTSGTDIEYVRDAQQYISSSNAIQNGTIYFESLQQYAERDPQIAILNLQLELLYGGEDLLYHLDDSGLYFRYLGSLNIIGNGATIVCNNESEVCVHTIINASISDVTFIGCEILISSVTNLMLDNVTFLNESSETTATPTMYPTTQNITTTTSITEPTASSTTAEMSTTTSLSTTMGSESPESTTSSVTSSFETTMAEMTTSLSSSTTGSKSTTSSLDTSTSTSSTQTTMAEMTTTSSLDTTTSTSSTQTTMAEMTTTSSLDTTTSTSSTQTTMAEMTTTSSLDTTTSTSSTQTTMAEMTTTSSLDTTTSTSSTQTTMAEMTTTSSLDTTTSTSSTQTTMAEMTTLSTTTSSLDTTISTHSAETTTAEMTTTGSESTSSLPDMTTSGTSSAEETTLSEATSTSTAGSEPHHSATTGPPVVTADQRRRQLKVVIPVGVVASILLVAVLISVVVIVCFIRRRKTGRSYDVLADSNVEMMYDEL